jgi:hypothetical protein
MSNNRIRLGDKVLLEQMVKVLPDSKALVSNLDSRRAEEASGIFLKNSKRCLVVKENKGDKCRPKVRISF